MICRPISWCKKLNPSRSPTGQNPATRAEFEVSSELYETLRVALRTASMMALIPPTSLEMTA